jgi:branched-chain amino acid transport system substrate-binding protein
MRRALGVAASALVMVGAACTASPHAPAPVVLGAMYPLSGSQGPGGVEEYHGVALAARMANELGGIHGRLIKLDTIDVPGPDAAAPAIDRFHRAGIQFVLGSYGSVLSYPASQRA